MWGHVLVHCQHILRAGTAVQCSRVTVHRKKKKKKKKNPEKIEDRRNESQKTTCEFRSLFE